MRWGAGVLQAASSSTTGTVCVPVVFALGGESLALEVQAGPDAIVDDLVAALAGGDVDESTALAIDGRLVDRDLPLAAAGIHPGSRLDLRAGRAGLVAPQTSNSPLAPVGLARVGGLDAGGTVALTEGRHLIGRSTDADIRFDAPTVSARHAFVDVTASGRVTISDAASTNGTVVDGNFTTGTVDVADAGVIALGAVHLRITHAPTTPDRPRPPGPFNRPPRSSAPPPADPLVPPAAPLTSPARARFNWTAIVLPLLVGGVLAVLWDPRMAAFALFTPVFAAGSWWEDRRRARREGTASRRQLERDVARFRDELRSAVGAERTCRERVAPDPAALVRRATSDDTRLWQRRLDHDDAFVVHAGTGCESFRPPLRDERAMADEAAAVLRDEGHVDRAPVLVDLAPGNVLGVVSSDRAAAVNVARSVTMQLAVHLGPADLRIAVLTDEGGIDAWRPAQWLPHVAGAGEAAGTRLLARGPRDVTEVVAALCVMTATVRLVVVDADGLTKGRPSPVRSLLAGAHGPVTGVVIARSVDDLPASCTHVLDVDPDGVARLAELATGRRVDEVLVAGISRESADLIGRALAAVDDPEAADSDASLPATVHALDLLGPPTADAIASRWTASRHDAASLPVMLGVTEDGPLVLDLVADGPHALLGGTTGAGKSELLRTLVASLALSVSPERLNIVLVDYKGGSAFDACARLPHTVGVVTDLDEHLGQRALQCLEAELRHREALLRAAGAVDLVHHDALRADAPLPRLLVVIDEFATMATELPDFIDSLVGIAQRGRSLGVHLVLATQRPAGAVKDNIRANTNLRIALRVQDATDSNDVLGAPDAAAISRRQPGRGLARLGPTELVPFQTARVSARSTTDDASGRTITVRPLPFGPHHDTRPATGRDAGSTHGRQPTDLERIVDAAIAAAEELHLAPPRRPWPDPLPPAIALHDLRRGAIGLADEPAAQRQVPFRWAPDDGNLLVYGTPGSGTTTVLETIALMLATTRSPDDLHLYVLDFGAGALQRLGELAHTGAVVSATEGERQRRLVRLLRDELDRRRTSTRPHPTIVVLLDGWSAFAAAFDDVDGMEVRDHLARVIADGPAVGISTVIAADNPNAVPTAVSSIVPSKLVLRLADRHDWSAFGIGAREVPAAIPGRGIAISTRLEVQVARAEQPTWAAVRDGARRAEPIAVLPRAVSLDTVVSSSLDGDQWTLAFGLADSSLAPAGLVFHHADHAIITGPARSGRSTALVAIAEAAASRPDVVVTAIALRPSPVRDVTCARVVTDQGDVAHVLETVAADVAPQLLVVDDGDAFDDASGAMVALLREMRPDVHVVGAGRVDAVRSGYGHWMRELRRSRLGLALAPQPEDGDIFGATFPRRHLPPPVPGRGLLVVDGVAEILQVGIR